MESLGIFYQSLLTIGVLVALGFLLGRARFLPQGTSRTLANLLLGVAMPAALFRAFPSSFDQASLWLFLQAVVGAVVVIGVSLIVARALFGRGEKTRILARQHQFAFIFNNASFLGYPLTMAIFGPESMIIYSGLMVVFNLALFSYGVWLFEHQLRLKNLLHMFVNPNIVAVLLGLVFFLGSISLPEFVNSGLDYLAGMMTPLSLLTIGLMLSQVRRLGAIIKKGRLWRVAILQLTLMPLITGLIMWILAMPREIWMIFVMIQALPTATSLALFAEKYNGDEDDASELVILSTILSALTLPVVMMILYAI